MGLRINILITYVAYTTLMKPPMRVLHNILLKRIISKYIINILAVIFEYPAFLILLLTNYYFDKPDTPFTISYQLPMDQSNNSTSVSIHRKKSLLFSLSHHSQINSYIPLLIFNQSYLYDITYYCTI